MRKRITCLLLIFGVICIGLTGRLFWIQIYKGAWYQKKAFEHQIHNRTVNAKRGIIYDTNGKELAESISADQVSAIPAEVEKPADVAKKLSELLEMDYENVYQMVTSQVRYVVIKRKIDKEVGDSVRKWIIEQNIKGINVDEDTQRVYRFGNLAAHAIGFTGIDNQGLDGLEKTMDKYLKGVLGRIVSESDALGREIPFKTERYINPEDGYNVVLTIDEVIQHFAEQALETAIADNKVVNGGVAIVMNPQNGDILALASKPDYDLNKSREKPEDVSDDEWNSLDENKRIELLQRKYWRNKAVSDTYEPGSTFKVITASAGLEEGVITPDTKFTCTGSINVAGEVIKCWRFYNPHGLQTFVQGVHNSCNPVFIDVGGRLGKEKFYKYLKAFGFGETTGIELPEETGILHRLKDVGPVELATISFGQRFQVTPIQMITAVSAVANGGKLMKPRLVKELTNSNHEIIKRFEPKIVRQAISKETSDIMRSILEGVVDINGTGTGRNAYVRGYRVAGKTGTSEKGVNTNKYIASFVGFAPADDPKICVLVLLDEPTGHSYFGGVIAAPVVGKIVEDTLKYLGTEPRFIDKDQIVLETFTPEVRGKTVESAKQALLNANLTFKIEGNAGNDTVVMQQTPKPNVRLPEKSVVILYTYNPEQEAFATVPNLLQKNVAEACKTAVDAGLNVNIYGMGSAVAQDPAAGTHVPKGSVIKVDFKYLDVE